MLLFYVSGLLRHVYSQFMLEALSKQQNSNRGGNASLLALPIFKFQAPIYPSLDFFHFFLFLLVTSCSISIGFYDHSSSSSPLFLISFVPFFPPVFIIVCLCYLSRQIPPYFPPWPRHACLTRFSLTHAHIIEKVKKKGKSKSNEISYMGRLVIAIAPKYLWMRTRNQADICKTL